MSFTLPRNASRSPTFGRPTWSMFPKAGSPPRIARSSVPRSSAMVLHLPDDAGGNAVGQHPPGDIADDDRPGPDHRAVPDRHALDHRRTDPDPGAPSHMDVPGKPDAGAEVRPVADDA